MTEPAVASSDATNIAGSIVTRGTNYVINGRKWWTSGACDPRCELAIFMGKTTPDGTAGVPKHRCVEPIYPPVHPDYLSLQLRLRNSHSDDVILPIAP